MGIALRSRVLIVGIGNPLRGDDGLGWHAAQRLEECSPRGDVEIVTCHQLTPELAEAVSQSGQVVLIDAACDGVPGTLVRRDVVPQPTACADFTHGFEIGALLALTQTLYGVCPPAVLFSVAAESFDLSEDLSDVVQAALSALVDQVVALIA